MRRGIVLLGALALFVTTVHAEDAPPVAPPAAAPAPAAKPAPPPTPEQAADAVLAAVAAKDDAALKALAAKEDPDPWVVADELIRRGQHDVADAFARAAPRVDTEKLPAYVASRRGKADDPVRRERLAAAVAARTSQRPEEALAIALAAVGPTPAGAVDDVVGIRFEVTRGRALHALSRFTEAARAFDVAADAALHLGWFVVVGVAQGFSGDVALAGGALGPAQAAYERAIATHERRANVASQAASWVNLGIVHGRRRDALQAVRCLERGLALAEAVGHRLWAANALANLGPAYAALGEGAKAIEAFERAAVAQQAVGATGVAAEMLGACGWMHERQGEPAKAIAAYVRARAAYEAIGDVGGAARSALAIGAAELTLARPSEALAEFERARTGLEAANDRAGAAVADLLGGEALLALQAFAKAVAAFERAIPTFEGAGDRAHAAQAFLGVGLAQEALRDPTKALAAYERALAELAALGDRYGQAAALEGMRRAHGRRGDRAQALAAAERRVAALEGLDDKAALAGAWIDLGSSRTQQLTPDLPAALEALERGRALAEEAGQLTFGANALNSLAVVHLLRGDPAAAITAAERALAAYEALGDRSGAAGALANLGAAYRTGWDLDKATAALERAGAAFETLGDARHRAKTLAELSRVHLMRRDVAASLAADRQALAAWEAAGDPVGAASALTELGDTYVSVGDLPKALSAYQRALAAQEALGDRYGAARTLLGLGVAHNQRGDHAKALATYERALAVQEAVGDRGAAAMTVCNLGVVHFGLGDPAKALAFFERALAAQEAVGDKASFATTLGNIANAHVALGDFASALAFSERARAAWLALGDRERAGAAWTNLAGVHLARGDATAALAACERAIAAQDAATDRRTAVVAQSVLGRVHAKLGNLPKAIAAFERAARSAEKLGATALLVEALEGLAGARLASGDAGRALADAHRAVTLLTSLVGGLGEEQGATARAQYAALFATGLRAAAKADDAPEAAFFLESGRAGSLLESLGARDALRWAGLPEELRLAESEARAREAAALVAYTKALDGGDLPEIRTRRAVLDAARTRVQETVERIQRDAKQEAQLFYPVASPLEDLQGFLAPGEALVSYGIAPDADAYALVLTREDARIVDLGASRDLVAACEAFDPSDPAIDPTPAVDRLRTLLVTPLALSASTTRLLVSPEGPLSYVPFAALVPTLEVVYEASGSTHGELRAQPGERGRQVLALGDADYTATYEASALELYAPDASAAASTTRGLGLAPLPGTRAEALAIGDVTLFAKDASEAGLRAALAAKPGRWLAVHFACHGLVDPERPTLSSLALTPDAGNDGFLTALEVLRMQVPTDLVVLSACETGKGKIVGGEGIVGLTRAFMYAGSPRVICSLWKVDDAATAALMAKFYELWNPRAGSAGAGTLSEPGSAPGESKGPNVGRPGLPTAEALRQAQAFVRSQEKWKHPYYWAAWVLWGLPS